MARIGVLLVFAFFMAVGCSDDQNPVKEYGDTLTGAIKKADKAKTVADLMTIKAEIMRYKVEHGEYPPDLQALNMQDIYPDMYSYDSETGAVALAQ